MVYDKFIFRSNSEEDSIQISKLLKEWGYMPSLIPNDYSKFSYYILVLKNEQRLVVGTKHSYEEVMDKINSKWKNIDPRIYTMKSLGLFRSLVDYLAPTPNYAPKKIIRTLESNNIVSFNDFQKLNEEINDKELKRAMLKKGKYNIILFTPEIEIEKRIVLSEFLYESGGIDAGELLTDTYYPNIYCDIIFTKECGTTDENNRTLFKVLEFGRHDIHQFLKDQHPSMTTSPMMNTTELKKYISITCSEAKYMYAPKKIRREI